MSAEKLTNDSRLEIHHDHSWHHLAPIRFGEEGIEARVTGVRVGVARGQGPVGPNTVLEAVELPTSHPHLDSRLADVDRDALPLLACKKDYTLFIVISSLASGDAKYCLHNIR